MKDQLCFENLGSLFRTKPTAVSFINGSEKYSRIRGRVMFYQMPCGVLVAYKLSGLPSKPQHCSSAIFALHIHSGSSCSGNESDPFANAGGHFNPQNCPHPYHAGDLPPVFSANGRAFSAFLTDRFKVNEILGKTIILHIGLDDFSTQPSGNAGEKIACGIITPIMR